MPIYYDMSHPYNIMQKLTLKNEDLIDKINHYFENDFEGNEEKISIQDLENAILKFAFHAPQ